MKTALAIRNVNFQDLGAFAPVLAEAGYVIRYLDIGLDDLGSVNPLADDLLMLLGGPVGVYEGDAYPFLHRIDAILKSRLAADRPTFGVCLGAQQIAAALGAKVHSTGAKEIGFSALSLTEAGAAGPLGHLESVPVMHWHGDTFETPEGADRLASTPACLNQAFARGTNVMALQFHPEVDAPRHIERWLVGQAVELTTSNIYVPALRQAAHKIGGAQSLAAKVMFKHWLAGVK